MQGLTARLARDANRHNEHGCRSGALNGTSLPNMPIWGCSNKLLTLGEMKQHEPDITRIAQSYMVPTFSTLPWSLCFGVFHGQNALADSHNGSTSGHGQIGTLRVATIKFQACALSFKTQAPGASVEPPVFWLYCVQREPKIARE